VLLGVPLARVVRRVREARDSRYRMLRGYFHGADDPAEFEEEGHARLHSITLVPGARAVGRPIGELALREFGAEVTAVRRAGIRGADPSDDMVLAEGDVVVLRGAPEALERAEERLTQPG
jgi:CPA2 family monovalent cation:H+ antiporter-2